ncbi:hypothetical protein, partial [Leyella stercorea]|uniref:hypothetical protein n=1 Tax=Leyella stercorea TaxID=363265 RepID=UPI001C2C1213
KDFGQVFYALWSFSGQQYYFLFTQHELWTFVLKRICIRHKWLKIVVNWLKNILNRLKIIT